MNALKDQTMDTRKGPRVLPCRQPTEEQRKAAVDGFFGMVRAMKAEQRAAVALAVPALESLIAVMGNRTGQSYKVRALLYSLYNGQATSLLEVVCLDWEIRKNLCAVLLAFSFEAGPRAVYGDDPTPDFYYAAMKSAITAAGQWEWFCEAHVEESEVEA